MLKNLTAVKITAILRISIMILSGKLIDKTIDIWSKITD